jgi:transposase InsO family protein
MYPKDEAVLTAETVHDIAVQKEMNNYLTEDHPEIKAAYQKHGGNVLAMRDDLRNRGYNYSRRKIARLLDDLGLPRVRRSRK